MLDWRFKKTFQLILKEKGKVKKIPILELRAFYITTTENQSKSSFSDFIERCNAFQMLWEQDGFYILSENFWESFEESLKYENR